jgi:endonuclease III
MKDSKTYSLKIGKLFRSLKQKYPKVKKIEYDDPAYALVYAIVSEHIRASTAKTIVRKMEKHFVDLNDLRVARTEEILDVLGQSTADFRQTASTLTHALNSVYNKYNMVSLATLKETGKRQAMKRLEKLHGLSRFAVDYCFLAALRGHCIPLTPKMIGYLKARELVHPDATDDDIEGFLERQIAATGAFEFYTLLRQESEKAVRKRAAKKTTKKKVSGKKTKKAVNKPAKTEKC